MRLHIPRTSSHTTHDNYGSCNRHDTEKRSHQSHSYLTHSTTLHPPATTAYLPTLPVRHLCSAVVSETAAADVGNAVLTLRATLELLRLVIAHCLTGRTRLISSTHSTLYQLVQYGRHGGYRLSSSGGSGLGWSTAACCSAGVGCVEYGVDD